MSELHTDTERARSAEFNARAYGLNEIGAHYFAGWLISAGFQRPEVMEQIENVLLDMETDPALQHCWGQETPAVLREIETTECLPSSEAQVPVAVLADTPQLSMLPAPATPERNEAAPARRPRILARILGTLFPKPRLAA